MAAVTAAAIEPPLQNSPALQGTTELVEHGIAKAQLQASVKGMHGPEELRSAELASLAAKLVALIDRHGPLILHITAADPRLERSTICAELSHHIAKHAWCRTLNLSFDETQARPAKPNAVDLRLIRPMNEQMRISADGATFVGSLPSWRSNPPRLHQVQEFYTNLRQDFSAVLIDAPPVLSSPLITGFAPLADGVFLMVEGEKSRRSMLTQSVDVLQDSDVNIMGIIYTSSKRRLPRLLDGIL